MTSDYNIGNDHRRRTTDQLEHFKQANGRRVAWNTEAPADFTFLFDPDHVLVREDAADAFERALAINRQLFDGESERTADPLPGQLRRYSLAARTEGLSVPEVVAVLRDEGIFERGSVTPDHWVHVAPGGTLCPAEEPEETGLTSPWPPIHPPGHKRRKRVSVVVVDTGWHPPAAADPRTPWLEGVTGDDELNGADLREYAGHGTFVAGVIRCVAPATTVFVEGFTIGGVGGGGILESEMIGQLDEALTHDPKVLNLSAGCRTHEDLPSLAFDVFYQTRLRDLDCVMVAAAGNDSSPAPFWPAAFPWAVGVGALDRDGRVSSFSNHGPSADVYAVGRNLVNAFPEGTFTCHETPDTGDVRVFSTGLARWSGTSFAAPVVAGMIARRISETGSTAADARDHVVASSSYVSDPVVGPIQTLAHWEP